MSFCIYEPILAFDFSTVKEISIFFFRKYSKLLTSRSETVFKNQADFLPDPVLAIGIA